MADSKTSTPLPAEQGQLTRPSTFDASWDAADASAFHPTSLPLAKVPRAWERQPHSPFVRNGKYRKVWKRNESRATRSKTQAGDGKQTMNKSEQSGLSTPRKVVKKRALDAPPADTTSTPGRVRPKSKAFAATRYDSPRRQSGRIARKLVSTGVSESSSDIYGSVWTGDKVQHNTTAKTTAPNIDGRDAQSVDKETMTAVTHHLMDSEGLLKETASAAEQLPKPALIPSEERAEEQVTEQVASEEDHGDAMRDANVEEGTQGDAIPMSDRTPNDPLFETGSDSNRLSENSNRDIVVQGKPEHLLEEYRSRLESSETRLEVPEENPTTKDQQSLIGTDDRTTEASRQDRISEAPEASDSLVQQPGSEPETTDPVIPASATEEFHTAETTSAAQIEPAGVPEIDSGTNAELDVSEPHAFRFSITKARKNEKDIREPGVEVEFEQEELVSPPPVELTTSRSEDSSVAESNVAQIQDEKEQTEAQPVQSGVGAESVTDDFNNESSSQDLASSTNQEEVTRRPNLEFSASSLFGESLDLGDKGKEPEEVDQDANVSDEYEDMEDSLVDMPSPSLSNNESPRFSSVADTLTLNLPNKLYSREDDPSEEEHGLDSPTDVDTAYLREFLSRSDAAKANRTTRISKRESLTNRRDSDRVRQALASPRVALENKDPNSPLSNESPSKRSRSEDEAFSETKKPRFETEAKSLLSQMTSGSNKDIAADLTLDQNLSEKAEATPEPKTTRRSSRTRATHLPSTPAASAPNRIPVRRADGNGPVVLKKTEAQELAIATRTNTRRNKGGAVAAPARLKKLQAEAIKADSSPSPLLVCSDPDVEIFEASKIKWDQQLVYFQEKEKSSPESLSDDELATGGVDDNLKLKKAATPRARRSRGLGASNGAPGKVVLATSLPEEAQLLPNMVIVEAEGAKTGAKKTSAKAGRPKKVRSQATEEVQKNPISSDPLTSLVESTEKPRKETPIPLPKPNPPKFPPSQLPTPAATRKSRLQSPKKIKLPEPSQPAVKQAQSKAGGVGISGGTPKIPVTRLSATKGGSSGSATGSGMSIGQRRRAGRRA